MPFISLSKVLVISVTSFVLFFSLHFFLQYDTPISSKISNYEHVDGKITKHKHPYTTIDSEHLLHWDAAHYHRISRDGYSEDSLWLFAFFPLFPLIWKATMLPPVGIILLNYILFIFSLVLLWRTFSKEKNYTVLLFLLNLPIIAPFVIPYTESLFFFGITLALFGFAKDKYWIYFAGALVTAMTRSAITIILLSLLTTEALFFRKATAGSKAYRSLWTVLD